MVKVDRKCHEQYMRRAIAKARQGIARGQTPFGACVVKDGNLVSCGYNTVWKDTDITAHAEVVAIRKACAALGTIDLSGCTIYTTCEPCPMCFSACHWARISAIVYGASIADARRAGFRELSISARTMKRRGGSDVVLTGGVLLKENTALFVLWAKRRGRKTY